MAFNFLKWLFGSRDSPTEVSGTDFFDIFTDTYVRELAFQSCVNLTANAVSKCEIKTFLAGEEVKGPEYYLWNYSPNQNQNSSAFWHKLIHTLYRDRTALVVENGVTSPETAMQGAVIGYRAVADGTVKTNKLTGPVIFAYYVRRMEKEFGVEHHQTVHAKTNKVMA